MSEILLTCPWCQTPNFSERGLRAHHCRARNRRKLSAPALHQARKAAGLVKAAAVSVPSVQPPAASVTPSDSSPSPMSKPATNTISLVASSAFHLAAPAAKKLMGRTLRDFVTFTKLEKKAASTAVVTGFSLHRVKVSAKGEFRQFIECDLSKKMNWTPDTAVKNSSFYMRLATAFYESAGLSQTTVIAALDGDAKANKAFNAALSKFIGDLSLNEVLIREGIKGVGLKTALEDSKPAPAGNDAALSAEDKIAQARVQAWEENWTAAQRIRAALTEPEQLQLLTDPKQLETLHAELVELNKLTADRLATLRNANA